MKKVELSCVKTPESFQKMKFLGKLAPEISFQLKKWMKLKSTCQKQCKNKAAILDLDRISSEPIYHIGDVQLELYLQVTATKVRYKEYLIYDGIGMFGSIGGSLGLFVGFSLFDSLSLVLEYVFKKFSSQ